MRKSVAVMLVLVILTASCLVMPLSVKAGSKTIVVPDDYPTISEAIRNANNGDTIFVKKGTYEEKTLEINKALSLIGEGAEFTTINLDPPFYAEFDRFVNFTFSWFDPSITVGANDFKLSGFTINTPIITNIPGGTISITGNRTQILGNIITTGLSVNGSYSNIVENTFSKTVAVGSYSNIVGNTFLEDTNVAGSYSNITENKFSGTIRASGSYLNISANNKASSNKVGTQDSGIRLEGSFCIVYGNNLTVEDLDPGIWVSGDGNIVARNLVAYSDVGIAIGGSGNIIYANKITNCRDNLFVPGFPPPDTGVAIRVSGNNTFYANYVADNTWGADVNSFPENNLTSTFYHNNFIGNTHQVAVVQGFPYGSDSFDNGKEGNFWSDYTGEDADGDGIGDTPYVIDDNRSDRYPLMAPFDIDSVTVELPEWASPPSVRLISPENSTYTSANITLEFTVNKQTSWMGYSLDGQETITINGNTTIAGLSSGVHNITVYASDEFENMGASETISFSVAEEPFPVAPVAAASVATIAVVGVGLLLYFKKRKR